MDTKMNYFTKSIIDFLESNFERFNCNSINYKITDNMILFDISQEYIKKTNLPIDINITIDIKSYIIPIEAIEKMNQMSIEEVKKFMLI